MNVEALRQRIPALQDSIYLNTGTFGPSPAEVLDEIEQALALVRQHGPYSPIVRQGVERERYEWTRAQAAQLLGAGPDEIVLTRSASDGINIIAHGLDWQPGDQVVISTEEHQSGSLPWLVLAQRRGIEVRLARPDPAPEACVENFARQITQRTRLVFASHVSCISGLRLPVREICALARSAGALAVIDGAHALGQFPVSVRELGCDAYIGCGHKWLLGPQGTSLAFIAREHLHTFQPSWIGWGAEVEESFDLEAQTFRLHDTARRFEFGTKAWPLFAGLGRAIAFIQDLGLEAIQARVRPLASALKERLRGQPFGQLLTPLEPDRSAGIVSFKLGSSAPHNLKEVLWDRLRLLVAYWPARRLLRLSIAGFTCQSELDRAAEAIVRYAA